MRASLLILGSLLLVGIAEARTAPRRGAASKPRSFEIQPPFPCGTPVKVACGYGPKCSRAHRRTKASGSTAEYYALDLVRADARNNGYGKPIVAVAAGVVRIAGWAQHGWAPYGKMVYIEHDYTDLKGSRYHSLYAHLRTVDVREGQHVLAGTVIGTLGGSSKHRQDVFGAHLHFAMYKNAKDTLGGGHAVVPEPFGTLEDLHSGSRVVACAAPEPLPVAANETDGDSSAAGGLVDR
jgi:murein DD-endopeptidase MepM/ murein hydrolase activator NlpD